MPRTSPARTPSARSARLLALLCCALSITASFDSVVVNQVLDGSLYAQAEQSSLTELEDPGENSDDMLSPPTPEVRREKQDQLVQGFVIGDVHPGRLPLSSIRRFRTHLHQSGCEHAYRNGIGVPLLC